MLGKFYKSLYKKIKYSKGGLPYSTKHNKQFILSVT
nr:MAG TPA: hypothetical protein [Caudoviricetes sp.]